MLDDLVATKPGLREKVERFDRLIKAYKRVIIAFSGGIDSTVLAVLSRESLGAKNVTLATGVSPSLSNTELESARKIANELGLVHLELKTNEFSNEKYLRNASDRCFWCKSALMECLASLKHDSDDQILLGVVLDDFKEERPGQSAAKKLGAKFLLADAGFYKSDVREIGRLLKLSNWNKPANSCLSSRISVNSYITKAKLERVDKAERFLKSLGLKILRVRDNNNIARLELSNDDTEFFFQKKISDKVVSELKRLGFTYVCLDLEGYRPAGIKDVGSSR